MKVRIIVTQHVQIDAKQFKSVVQRLTGKDSMVAVETMGQAERGGDIGRNRPVPREMVHEDSEGGVCGVDAFPG